MQRLRRKNIERETVPRAHLMCSRQSVSVLHTRFELLSQTILVNWFCGLLIAIQSFDHFQTSFAFVEIATANDTQNTQPNTHTLTNIKWLLRCGDAKIMS